MVKQILTGHVSPETAYVVERTYHDGFRLRCKIRYWLEYKKNHGVRLVSQTTNPKRPPWYWNLPKASTYCKFGGCMYLNEENHVTWSGLSMYTDANEAEAWREQFGAGVPAECVELMNQWCRAKRAYDDAKAKREANAALI
jgi:hypothetical protein